MVKSLFSALILFFVCQASYGQQVIQNQRIHLNGRVVINQPTIVRNSYFYGRGQIIVPYHLRKQVIFQNNTYNLSTGNWIELWVAPPYYGYYR